MKRRYSRWSSNTFFTNQKKFFLKAVILDLEIHCHRIFPFIRLFFRTITWGKYESVPVYRYYSILATNTKTGSRA